MTQRRATRAVTTSTAVTPNEPALYTKVTNQLRLWGAG